MWDTPTSWNLNTWQLVKPSFCRFRIYLGASPKKDLDGCEGYGVIAKRIRSSQQGSRIFGKFVRAIAHLEPSTRTPESFKALNASSPSLQPLHHHREPYTPNLQLQIPHPKPQTQTLHFLMCPNISPCRPIYTLHYT